MENRDERVVIFRDQVDIKTFIHKQNKATLSFFTTEHGFRGFRCGTVEGFVSEKALKPIKDKDWGNLQYVLIESGGKKFPTICPKGSQETVIGELRLD